MKAELKQSLKLTKKAKAHFTFVSKADMDIPGLMVRNQKSLNIQPSNREINVVQAEETIIYLHSFKVGAVLLGTSVWLQG